MLKNKKVKTMLLLVAAVGLNGSVACAQGLGNSPYSRVGLGEYNANLGGVRQMGMGGVGLAAPNATNVNELNPALLYYTARTTFEAGYVGQYKTVKNATTSSRTGSGTLGYLALAVPLGTRWGAAVGLKPLSAVDYETNVVRQVTGDPTALVLIQRQGTGGVSEAYFAQGFHLNKSLSIGATASYVFGAVDETQGTTVQTASAGAGDKLVDRIHTRYSDFNFRAGVHYRHKVGKDLNLNLAGVYGFKSDIGARRTGTQERQYVNGALVAPAIQTDDEEGSVLMPALAQVGVSIDNDKNFSLSLDAAQQQWSDFRRFGDADASLRNTLRFGLGGEFTPDPGSVEHYFRRVSYRAGVALAQLPYLSNGQTLYDRSVSWGFAFPLPSATPLEATTFSLAFTYGVRGNTETVGSGSNVQENYIKGQFGVTLNNRWFIKRRLQ